MRRPTSAIERLRLAIDCLPAPTREAMLEGIDRNNIIVGAYTDRDGGVCPMLAAHRCGGRTSFLSFARAWDRFTRAGRRARRATPRELRILRSQLEASLLTEERVDLSAAIAEHRARAGSVHRPRAERAHRADAERASRPRRRSRAPSGDPDRTRELRRQPGWAWLRPLRRLDEYEQALAQVRRQEEGGDARLPPREGSAAAAQRALAGRP